MCVRERREKKKVKYTRERKRERVWAREIDRKGERVSVCKREKGKGKSKIHNGENEREREREGNVKFDPAKTFQIFPIR